MPNSQFKETLLEVMSGFHLFCEAHNLRYYLIGGGLIGAVRHKGFIPWDDDIDVAMPREDYKRLLELRSELQKDLKLSIPFIDKEYTNTKPRIYSTKIKIKEQFIKYSVIGPWIDIFPLDYTFNNKLFRKIHFRLVYIFKVLNACKLGGISVKKGRNKAKSKLVLYFLLKPIPRSLLSTPFEYLQTLKTKPSKYMGNLMGRWREKEFIETNETLETTLVTFENIHLKTFKNYDIWLTRVYGSYMDLPPKEQQIPDHYFDMID